MTARRNKRRMMAEINVVPYIDVMLVLLIIFMVTAPMLTQGVEVALPTADSEPVPQRDSEPLVVTVDRGGRFYANVGGSPDEALDSEQLLSRVVNAVSADPELPVYVRGDREVPYGAVVEMMVQLQKAGVDGVGLLTDVPE